MSNEPSVSAAARAYASAGYVLVAWDAIYGKRPKSPGWGLRAFPADQVADHHSIGVNHGLSGTAAIDVDNLEKTKRIFEAIGLDLDALAESTMTWCGRPDRLKLLYCAPNPPLGVKAFSIDSEVIFELRGALPGKQAQDLLPPSLHPDTKKRYELRTRLIPRDELPAMPEPLVEIWRNWEAWRPALLQLLGVDETPALASTKERIDRGSASVIDAYNTRTSCSDVLERSGYKSVGGRWLRPGSSTKEPGVVRLPNGDRIYSHGGDALNDGHAHDAFDCFRILEHDGDFKRAVRAAADELGMRRPTMLPKSWTAPSRYIEDPATDETTFSKREQLLAQTQIDLGGRSERSEDVELPGLLSDDDLARRFTARHRDRFLYCEELGRWYQWTGTHWAHDNTRAVFDAARASSRRDLAEALQADLTDTQAKALRTRLGSAVTIAAIVRLASADRHHAVRVTELDSDPWSLNTPGGILDLTTGALRPHDPAQRMTKIAAAAPTTECPNFLKALERSIPDPEVRGFLQRLLGSYMTGIVRDHKVVVTYGLGANGKSLITNAVRKALGDYAVILASEVLMESHNDRHPTEIAVLRGARLALCSEVDSGRRWNEARLKRLSGGDPITARLIARDPFEFQPTHKFIVTTNSKPGLRTLDEATRRRILLVDFDVTIPEAERDAHLPERIHAEAGGILGWILIGCLDWQEGGLRPPQAVMEATTAYLDREDSISEWMIERCQPMGQSSLSTLHGSYRTWAEEIGLPPIGRNTFGDHLEARGLQKVEIRPRHWFFMGISLSPTAGIREPV